MRLRHAGEDDRSFRQSQVDAAVRFCGKVFGPDYAAMLAKAGRSRRPSASASPPTADFAQGLIAQSLPQSSTVATVAVASGVM